MTVKPKPETDVEVIIVGGGPAGSTCAWRLRELGVESLILDRSKFPRTKLCAGWITPKVVRKLELDLGGYPHSLAAFDRLHVSFHGRRTLRIPTRQYSIRRCEFDDFLLRRSGVPVRQHTVRQIRIDDDHYVVDETFRAKYLVGAGGTNCPVYRHLFEDRNPRAREMRIVAMEEEFPCEFSDPNCYLWFFDRNLPGYSWYVPKGNGYLNLGIGAKYAELDSRGETIRSHWDDFVGKVNQLNLVNGHAFKPRGYSYYLRRHVAEVRSGNAFVVGDAAGLATKDMGEGIGPAIESGIRVARAIAGRRPYSIRGIGKYSLPGILLPWL
jgi:flavin-dependent dehydrogenase